MQREARSKRVDAVCACVRSSEWQEETSLYPTRTMRARLISHDLSHELVCSTRKADGGASRRGRLLPIDRWSAGGRRRCRPRV
jgi:hypothetical protein